MTKKCFRCQLEKDVTEFRNTKSTKDGLTSSCKQCLSAPGKRPLDVDSCKKRIRLMTPEEKLVYLRKLYIAGQDPEECAEYFECELNQINEALLIIGVKENTRWCSKCETFKDVINFSKDKHNRTGYRNWCNECFNNYRKKDNVQEQIKLVSQEYYLENKDKINQQTAEYYDRTKDERKGYYHDYYQENAAEHNLRSSVYRAMRLQAMPSWVDKDEIRKIYKESRRLTLETGIRHSVDHIFALQAKDSCGLHVPWNLQILTLSENCAIGNRNNHSSNLVHIFEDENDDGI